MSSYSVMTVHVKDRFLDLFEKKFKKLIKTDSEYLAFVKLLYGEKIPKTVKLDGYSLPVVYLFLKYLKDKHGIDYATIEEQQKREKAERLKQIMTESEGRLKQNEARLEELELKEEEARQKVELLRTKNARRTEAPIQETENERRRREERIRQKMEESEDNEEEISRPETSEEKRRREEWIRKHMNENEIETRSHRDEEDEDD